MCVNASVRRHSVRANYNNVTASDRRYRNRSIETVRKITKEEDGMTEIIGLIKLIELIELVETVETGETTKVIEIIKKR